MVTFGVKRASDESFCPSTVAYEEDFCAGGHHYPVKLSTRGSFPRYVRLIAYLKTQIGFLFFHFCGLCAMLLPPPHIFMCSKVFLYNGPADTFQWVYDNLLYCILLVRIVR